MLSYVLITIYLLLLLVFGNFYHKKIKGKDFTLAGRKMRTLPVLVSILATETSAASLLLFPDLGFNPAHRFIFLQLAAGMILGRLLSAWLLIGPVYRSGKASIYEILADKFSVKLANSTAVFYTIATVLAAGVRLFIGAIALSILLNIHNGNNQNSISYLQVTIFIVLAGGIAIYYSQKGGIKAVIYTDNFQFLLILVALISILTMNLEAIDFTILKRDDFIKLTPPLNSGWANYTYSLPLAIVGGMVLSLGSHGIDQTTIQRVLAQRSEKEAKNSIIYSAIVIGPFIFLFLLVGFIISQVNTGTNDAQNLLDKKQYIYPWYLQTTNSVWLSAITSVAFLSAAMSSIDSALHSMATSIKQTSFNFIKKFPVERLTLIAGASLVISALVFQFIKRVNPDAMLISLALGATGMIFSPMAALYLVMYHFPGRKNQSQKSINQAAVAGLLSGICLNLVFFGLNNFSITSISWLLSLVTSFVLTMAVYTSVTTFRLIKK